MAPNPELVGTMKKVDVENSTVDNSLDAVAPTRRRPPHKIRLVETRTTACLLSDQTIPVVAKKRLERIETLRGSRRLKQDRIRNVAFERTNEPSQAPRRRAGRCR